MWNGLWEHCKCQWITLGTHCILYAILQPLSLLSLSLSIFSRGFCSLPNQEDRLSSKLPIQHWIIFDIMKSNTHYFFGWFLCQVQFLLFHSHFCFCFSWDIIHFRFSSAFVVFFSSTSFLLHLLLFNFFSLFFFFFPSSAFIWLFLLLSLIPFEFIVSLPLSKIPFLFILLRFDGIVLRFLFCHTTLEQTMTKPRQKQPVHHHKFVYIFSTFLHSSVSS